LISRAEIEMSMKKKKKLNYYANFYLDIEKIARKEVGK